MMCLGVDMGRLDRIVERETLRRWKRTLGSSERDDPRVLKTLTGRARALSAELDRVIHAAETRAANADGFARPLHTEWAWRPELWSGPVRPAGLSSAPSGRGFGREAKIFHDCPRMAHSVRQQRASGGGRGAPWEVRIDVYQFEGSFFSMALDLPADGFQGLTKEHIVALALCWEAERDVAVYARLNLQNGPNVVQSVTRVGQEGGAEFDLAASDLTYGRPSGAWIDLILESPEMNRITVSDLTVSRRPRAAV